MLGLPLRFSSGNQMSICYDEFCRFAKNESRNDSISAEVVSHSKLYIASQVRKRYQAIYGSSVLLSSGHASHRQPGLTYNSTAQNVAMKNWRTSRRHCRRHWNEHSPEDITFRVNATKKNFFQLLIFPK